MATRPRAKNDASISVRRMNQLLRSWGWEFVGGTKHKRYRLGTVSIPMRRSNGAVTPTRTLSICAKANGVSVEQWLQGPPEGYKPKVGDPTEDDLNFFVHRLADPTPLTPDETDRFQDITAVLTAQDTLKSYLKLQSQYQSEGTEELKLEEVKADPDGYITLEQALELRDMKKNVLNRTNAVLLAAMAYYGDIEDTSGKATGILMKGMGTTQTSSSISGQVKAWCDVDLLWRDVSTGGKRTYKIGLSVPIKLTEAEIEEYLGIAPAETEESVPEQNLNAISEVVNVVGHSLPRPDFGPAIVILQQQHDVIDAQISELIGQREGVLRAIKALKNNAAE